MKKSNLFLMLLATLMAFSASAVPVGTVPVHRPLIEEYSGTWCGWCIRGIVGMELLSETFGEDFVGVVYHYGDAMQTINPNYYPNDVEGFPTAYAERAYEIDPLYGFGSTSGGIIDDMSQLAAVEAIAGIDVTAMWTSEAKTKISVDVTSFFTSDISSGNYAFEVMLLADDLYGIGSSWNQANYYSGWTAYGKDPYLGEWVKKPETVTGLHFNDVLLATSRPIAGSLPTTLVAYDDYSYNYTMNVERISTALVQNKDNLRIIAILVDRSTGQVVNANRCYISDYVAAIPGDVDGDKMVSIADVTALIDYLLSGDASSINVDNADVDGDTTVSIADVTALIDLLLSGN